MGPSNFRKINPENPEPEIIAAAAAVIQQGGVVAFPTRCLYGLGADAFDAGAINRVTRIKQRPPDNPILVLIDSRQQLQVLVRRIPPAADVLMQTFWPGRLTQVFEARATLPQQLTAYSGNIGVRLVGHPVALALVKHTGRPITGTSANLSGQPGCHRVPDLAGQVAEKVDLILDAGALKGGIGSTVVDVTVDPPRIIREGAVTAEQIKNSLIGL